MSTAKKLPFPALLIESSEAQGTRLAATACYVREIFEASGMALIEIPCRSGSVTKMVSFANLASNPTRAASLIENATAALLAKTFPAAPAENPPSEKLAGAGAA